MRVLHLFDWYLPSTLSWVSRLLLHLEKTEVWIAAPWIVKNHFYHTAFRYLHVPFSPQRLLRGTQEAQFPTVQKLLTRSQRFFPSYAYWLQHKLSTDPPDILHAHFGPTGCLYLPLAKKMKRPLVVTFYGFDYQKILTNRPVFRQKYQQLFAEATRVIAASPNGCAALEAMGCPAQKLATVRPSPAINLFPFAARRKPTGQLNLIQLATFTPKKGHLTTLESFRLALADCPNLQLTLAGEVYDRSLFAEIQTQIRRHQLQEKVHCLPAVDHRQVPAFLANFDAFIHPSCYAPDGDHEATPVVLLEAQATGLPVLATRHFDLADEVSEDYSGYLTEENNAVALAENIRRLYRMRENEFSRLSRNARIWVEQKFSVEQSARDLQKIYDDLI